MAVTDWIDEIAKAWGTIDDGKGGKVRSYRVFEKAEFPESISIFPSAITYITDIPFCNYSAGGPNEVRYNGQSEFHLYPNVSKGNYPSMMLVYQRIFEAAAAHITLQGKVSEFILTKQNPIKPGVIRFGTEAEHLGMIVSWTVMEESNLIVNA
jgi:hypothetical protein